MEVKLGRKDEPGIHIEKSQDLVAVRTRSRRSLREAPVPPPSAAQLRDAALVMELPEAGVEVYRMPRVGRSVEDRKAALQREQDVQFAGGVFTEVKTGEPILYTENFFVKFHDEVDPDDAKAILREYGLDIKRELTYAANSFFVSAPEGTGEKTFDIATQLLARKEVEYCHPELVRRRAMRGIFPNQWHLKCTTVNGITINAHANVEAAHAITKGEGTTIAIIDDGVDIDHPEFATPGKVVAPRDATFAVTHASGKDPRPKRSAEKHGTACAGVACGAGVDGASGVAPAAKLMPIRQAADLMSQQEADAFVWAADNGADVISCSWGPPDGAWYDPEDPLHTNHVPMPASTRLAIEYAQSHGRGGRGCVVLFAAGNGNERVEFDGYASSDLVVAVAACNDTGKRSVYSDFGRAVWCSFPSNDFAFPEEGRPAPLTPGIWTTDRRAARGYNAGLPGQGDPAGNYTNSFGGTSSACPGAAGICALILSVNPNLTWREVKDVLRQSCTRIDPQTGAYGNDGHSDRYGYGRLDAVLALERARPATNPSVTVSSTVHQIIPDMGAADAPLDVADGRALSSIRVSVNIAHTYIGDLLVTLRPPAALNLGDIVLHNRAGGSRDNLRRTYDETTAPGLAALAGRNGRGIWTLHVEDKAAEDSGTIRSWSIELRYGGGPRIVWNRTPEASLTDASAGAGE